MVYGYTKTTKVYKIYLENLKKSILTHEKGLPYWGYTGIQKLQSIQNSVLDNFIYQFYLTKRGFHIDGIRVYEDYQSIQNLFTKLKKSILTHKKGLPYWWYTGIRRLQSIQDSTLENFIYQF